MGSSGVDDKKTEPVAKAVKTADKKPVIKVGEVVESKGEKVKKDIPPRVKGKDVEKTLGETLATGGERIKDAVIDAAVKAATEDKKEDEEKDIDEKLTDKIKEKAEEKLDPVSKVEDFIEKKTEEAKDKLADSLLDADNKAFEAEEAAKKAAREAASGKPPTPHAAASGVPSPSSKGSAAASRIVDAGGRTSAVTPAAARTIADDAAGDIFRMTPTKAIKTLAADGAAVAKSLAGGAKNSKNLRLAAAAALLSGAGFGIGKLRNRMGAKQNQEVSPDESEILRRSLLEDG